ncbi:MAG: TPR end-of-group domain-containing protein, partial [Chthoniobacterales bacterium]
LLPIEQDAFLGPGMLSALAEIYGRVGEEDAAIDLLERLLTIPAGVSLLDLKNDWSWDPLRKNPRFQKILGSPEPKVIYR